MPSRKAVSAPPSDTDATLAAAPFDVMAYLTAGYLIGPAQGGGHNATSPDGIHGYGATPEDAVLNIGATIIPLDGRRQLHRTNGDVIELDPSLVPAE